MTLLAAILLAASVALTGGSSSPATAAAASAARPIAGIGPSPVVSPPTFAAGIRHFTFKRGDRPLPTTVWYPVPVNKGKRRGSAVSDEIPAVGPYPLILWSHGLGSTPERLQQVPIALAEAGYIVAGPWYPNTKLGRPNITRADVPNQPLDASQVITELLALDVLPIDRDRIAAAGHSAGGSTTNGLLALHRDKRIKAGIICSGRPMGSPDGTSVPALYIHGDKDPVVAYSEGRTAYSRMTGPKAFLTIKGGDHGAGLGLGDKVHPQVMATMLDFLRWALDGDTAAKHRLMGDALSPGLTTFEESKL